MIRDDYPADSLYYFISKTIRETLNGVKDSEVKAKVRRLSIQAKVYGIGDSGKDYFVPNVGALTPKAYIISEGISTVVVDISADNEGDISL